MKKDSEQLRELIEKSEKIIFFGGAGVSTESGIPDFRSSDGIFQQKWPYPPEQMISYSFYRRCPEDFFAFYRQTMLWPDARPGLAHRALVALERQGKAVTIITQNIDGLHQKAGSSSVLELHGSVWRNYCESCGKEYELAFILESKGVPSCDCGGVVRPDVVLYEETLDSQVLQKAAVAVLQADLMIVAGTSLAVYPAASFAEQYQSGSLVIINRTPTPQDQRADLLIRGNVGEVLGELYCQ